VKASDIYGGLFLNATSAIVRCGEHYGLIDMQGNYLLDPVWNHIRPFREGRAIVVSSGGGFFDDEVGVIDEQGQFVVEPAKNQNLSSYEEGFAMMATPGDKVGFIDRDGQIAIPLVFFDVGDFDGGLAAVAAPGIGTKRGYIDTKGRWVIEPTFRKAYKFKGPLALVERNVDKSDKELAYIDRTGAIVYRMRFGGFINPEFD
jgi:hypothetical protein